MPITVYAVVVVGLAVTEVPVVPLRSVAGDQTYVVAPEAVNVASSPKQIVASFTVTTGDATTVMVSVATAGQPLPSSTV